MNILHIAPNSPYNDYWGYQDNLLPKYHKKIGHNVTLIITNTMHKDGKIVETECSDYVLDDGVRVIRLKKKQYLVGVLTNINSKLSVYQYLKEIKPDFVFYHGLCSTTIFDVIRYKKEINPQCKIVQDNHMDYNNCGKMTGIKARIIQSFFKYINKKSVRYVSKVYGVTPWRKTFAEDYYGIPSDKTDVLIMGADDEKIDFSNRDKIRRRIREQYGISDSDFLIVTGGKIDVDKHIDTLMKVCSEINQVKLLVFGQVFEEIKIKFYDMLEKCPNLIYIGWINADVVYNYFFAADLVVFPGGHSVMWEQACASKVPCLFRRWEGMEHVNNGGNSDFIDDISEEGLQKKVLELLYTNKYYEMKKVAQSKATDIFLYSQIVKKSLECAEKDD